MIIEEFGPGEPPSFLITSNGERALFVRHAQADEGGLFPMSQLMATEFMIAPGLIYQIEQ